MDYEVVIPAAPKDYDKLSYVISSLSYLNPAPQYVKVICPRSQETPRIPFPMEDLITGEWNKLNIQCHDELDVLPGLDPNTARNFRRPPWIYQQFVKLFQDVTTTDNYLVVDADLIINRPLDLLVGGKPKFFMGVDQNHQPYFNMSEETFGFGREYPHSFISEIMMFNKGISRRILAEFFINHELEHSFATMTYEEAVELLYLFVCKKACENWIPADYELYGNFVEKHFKDRYVKVPLKTNLKGKLQQNWTDEELEEYIIDMKGKDYDTFTAHTWL